MLPAPQGTEAYLAVASEIDPTTYDLVIDPYGAFTVIPAADVPDPSGGIVTGYYQVLALTIWLIG